MSVITVLAVATLLCMLLALCKQVLPGEYLGFHPLFFYADEILPCFLYAVITVKTVVLKTLNNWTVKVTDT